jgi:hypothetical protein
MDEQATALSQEGSGIAKRIPRGMVPKPKRFAMGTTSHNLDCVSIVLPKFLDGSALPGSHSLRS